MPLTSYDNHPNALSLLPPLTSFVLPPSLFSFSLTTYSSLDAALPFLSTSTTTVSKKFISQGYRKILYINLRRKIYNLKKNPAIALGETVPPQSNNLNQPKT